jgi:hypothetical protein
MRTKVAISSVIDGGCKLVEVEVEGDEMSNLHRGHSIDASCQVSVHLAKRFQRRRFF